MSLSPSRDRRTQSGSSTPNPAPDSSGAACRRKPNASSVSSVTSAGAGLRSARSSLGKSLAARPSPASSSSSGCLIPAARPAVETPAQTSVAGIIRLGSSVDWSANSTRQSPGTSSGVPPLPLASAEFLAAPSPAPSSPSSGSISRKQVRTGPAGSCAAECQASSRAASSAASCLSSVVVTSTWPPADVSATIQRSATGMRAGRCPRRAGSSGCPASRARAAASVRASSAAVRIRADDPSPASAARHIAGIPAASSRARSASAPDSTGRHLAACPPSSARSAGSTRPRSARSAPSRATAAR